MALVTVDQRVETGLGWMEAIRVTVTTTGDTHESKLGVVDHVQISDRTTTGGAKVSVSGQTITITCTNGDVCDLLIIGKP